MVYYSDPVYDLHRSADRSLRSSVGQCGCLYGGGCQGPNYSTSTVMYLLYEIAFKTTKEFGYANAMGVVLAIVIALFSALQFKVMNGGTSE